MSEVQISFTSPPVVEVVAGVALDGLTDAAGSLLSAFWAQHLRGRYPNLEPQAPYTPPVEQFPAQISSLNIQFGIGAPMQRLWASTADGQELLQLQPGWFACNWRKVQPSDEYDRWERRRASFEGWFSALSEFLVAEGGGEPKVTQCEVTYINHIRPVEGIWSAYNEFERVFRARLSPDVSLPLEQVAAQASFVMDRDGGPHGRLHAKVFPAIDRDGITPLYVLDLTARGLPAGDGLSGALGFLDEGRTAINSAFIALTTDEMHEAWGRVE